MRAKCLVGTALACVLTVSSLFAVEAKAGEARGGTAFYSAYQTSNFYAGDVYVNFEYGVQEFRAYVDMSANDYCDFSVDAIAYDWWGLEYTMYGGSEQTTSFSISCKNLAFDQMKRIQGTVRADGPESGTSVYVDHDFTGDFYS